MLAARFGLVRALFEVPLPKFSKLFRKRQESWHPQGESNPCFRRAGESETGENIARAVEIMGRQTDMVEIDHEYPPFRAPRKMP